MDKEARLTALRNIIKKAQVTSKSPANITPAYIQGFYKAAEDAGLDPEELMKMAGFWGDLWDGTKDLASSTWGAIKELPGAAWEQVSDGTALKNYWTGIGRMTTGVGQGALGLLSGAGGVISGAFGSVASGLTGNGWGNGWSKGYDAGSNFVDNLGFGDWDIGAAKRRMGAWQNQLRDDYLERNNIDPSKPGSMNWADKLALFGSDLTETSGKGIGENLMMNGLASGVGSIGGLAARGTANSTSLLGKGINYLGRGVRGAADFMKMTGPMGPKMSLFMSGMNAYRTFDNTANYNRQDQDVYNLGNSNLKSYYNAIKPGDISDQITYNV